MLWSCVSSACDLNMLDLMIAYFSIICMTGWVLFDCWYQFFPWMSIQKNNNHNKIGFTCIYKITTTILTHCLIFPYQISHRDDKIRSLEEDLAESQSQYQGCYDQVSVGDKPSAGAWHGKTAYKVSDIWVTVVLWSPGNQQHTSILHPPGELKSL